VPAKLRGMTEWQTLQSWQHPSRLVQPWPVRFS
jgi:hypothetical protein